MEFVGGRGFWAVIMVAAAAAIPAARGVYMDLPSTGSKCVSEELHNNVVVMGDYYAFIGEDYDVNSTVHPTITIKVTSPYGNILYNKEKVMHGEFAFTTTEVGNYMACFSLDGGDHHGKRVHVGIEWKVGIAAKDYGSVAKKEKIEGLELELKKLEDRVVSIHETMSYMMTRESEMREVSEKTNGRVARYSLMSLGLCIVVSLTQSLYLRRYFQRKKLI